MSKFPYIIGSHRETSLLEAPCTIVAVWGPQACLDMYNPGIRTKRERLMKVIPEFYEQMCLPRPHICVPFTFALGEGGSGE